MQLNNLELYINIFNCASVNKGWKANNKPVKSAFKSDLKKLELS